MSFIGCCFFFNSSGIFADIGLQFSETLPKRLTLEVHSKVHEIITLGAERARSSDPREELEQLRALELPRRADAVPEKHVDRRKVPERALRKSPSNVTNIIDIISANRIQN